MTQASIIIGPVSLHFHPSNMHGDYTYNFSLVWNGILPGRRPLHPPLPARAEDMLGAACLAVSCAWYVHRPRERSTVKTAPRNACCPATKQPDADMIRDRRCAGSCVAQFNVVSDHRERVSDSMLHPLNIELCCPRFKPAWCQ